MLQREQIVRKPGLAGGHPQDFGCHFYTQKNCRPRGKLFPPFFPSGILKEMLGPPPQIRFAQPLNVSLNPNKEDEEGTDFEQSMLKYREAANFAL